LLEFIEFIGFEEPIRRDSWEEIVVNPIRAEKCYIKECFQPQAYTICLKGTIVFHLSSRQMKMSKNVCVCLRLSAAKYPCG